MDRSFSWQAVFQRNLTPERCRCVHRLMSPLFIWDEVDIDFPYNKLFIAKEHALQKLTAKEGCFFSALFCPSFSATTLHTSSKLRCCRCRLLALSRWHHSPRCRLLCDILGRLEHVSIKETPLHPLPTLNSCKATWWVEVMQRLGKETLQGKKLHSK